MSTTVSTPISFDYPQQDSAGVTCTAQAWAKVPPHLAASEKAAVVQRIKQLLIEKDAALVRRFQKVIVNPPTLEQTKEILINIRDKYQDFHKVVIPGVIFIDLKYLIIVIKVRFH